MSFGLALVEKLQRGPVVFAIAAASVAILGVRYGDFVPIGQSLYAWLPGRPIWVYGSAFLVIVASIALCFSRTATAGARTLCACYAAGMVACVPQVLSQPLSVGAWYSFCEAATYLAGAGVLYTLLRRPLHGSTAPGSDERVARAGQILFGLTCIFYGWSHFFYAEYTAAMVPAWLPIRLGLAYLTGAGHVAAGVAIVIGVLPRLAANLEAAMMSLFGLLVWVPSFFVQPTPEWAKPAQTQWSESVVNLLLAAAAWMVALSLSNRKWLGRGESA